MVIDPLSSLTPAKYLSLARQLSEHDQLEGALRVALLSSNSFSFLEPYLLVECARRGLATRLSSAPFGQLEQAILAPAAEAGEFAADIVVIALRPEDIVTDAYLQLHADALAEHIEACVERVENCVTLVRERTDATLVVANFAVPALHGSGSILEASDEHSVAHAIHAANRRIAERIANVSGVVIWDYCGLVRSSGTSTWTDERLWRLARQPIAGANLPTAAAHLARTIAATTIPPAKCLVLDLDNTIWGGAAGDNGIGDIQLGDDYPGSVFASFQRAARSLKQRGILLAIASKNDEAVAKTVFDEHPDMVLKWDDFAVRKINWDAKSTNLQAIAEELNIGVDALAFFDDNPVEREEVRQNAPAVQVIEVPMSPLEYVEALFDSELFDLATTTAEDAKRAELYKNEARRQQVRREAGSMQEFLAGLEMKFSSGPASADTMARVVQLVAKTNQFNLTTRRHSAGALQRMSDDERFDVIWTRLADRYGDSGIIGVTVVEYAAATATIDTFVMSCRVMNREVEQGMLCQLVERAAERGCQSVVGEYRPTERNEICRHLYLQSGFTESSSGDDGSRFVLDLKDAAQRPAWPAVLSV